MAERVYTGDLGDGNWNAATNWLNDTIAIAADDVTIRVGAGNISAFNNSAVEYASFRIEKGYTGTIGNNNGDLQIDVADAGLIDLGGTGQTFLNFGSAATDLIIRDAGTPGTGQYGTNIKGTALSNIYREGGGTVGIGTDPTDTTTETNVVSVSGSGTTTLGAHVTDLAGTGDPDVRINDSRATVISFCNVDVLQLFKGGRYEQREGIWGTAHIEHGTAYPDGTGTYTATNIGSKGKVLNTRDQQPKTFTDTTIENGGTLLDPSDRMVFTNPIQFPEGMDQCTLDFGVSIEFTPIAI